MAKQAFGAVAADMGSTELKQRDLAPLLKKKLPGQPEDTVPAADVALLPASAGAFAAGAAPVMVAAGEAAAAGGLFGGGVSVGTAVAVGAVVVGGGLLVSRSDDDGAAAAVPVTPVANPTVINVVRSAATVDEGGTVTFTVNTKDVAPGSFLNYEISGVSAADIDRPLSGTISVLNNNTAVLQIAIRADQQAEGQEVLKFTVAGRSDVVTINDTSTQPPQNQAGSELRIGQDQIIGGSADDVFTAPLVLDEANVLQNTLESLDIIIGGAGVDTLVADLRFVKSDSPVRPQIEEVENVTITARGASPVTMDLQDSSGVVVLTSRAAEQAMTFNSVGDTRTLAVSASNKDVNFFGSSRQGFEDLVLQATDVGTASVATNVTVPTAVETVIINLDDANVAYAGLTKVTSASIVTTDKNLLSFDAALNLEVLEVLGSGSLRFRDVLSSNLRVLNASASTTSIIADIRSQVAIDVIGGGGNDLFQFGMGGTAVVADSTVSTGGGNNLVYVSNQLGQFKAVTGGDGTDAISITDGSTLNTTTAELLTGFEILEVAGGKGNYNLALEPFTNVLLRESINGALSGALTLSGAANSFVFEVASAASSNASFALGAAQTIALKTTSGTSDVVSISTTINDGNRDNTADGSIVFSTSTTIAGVETINVVSKLGTADGGTLPASQAYSTTFDNLIANSIKALVLQGDTNAVFTNLTNSGNSLAAIDASKLTGGLTITSTGAAARLDYDGAAGVDTYTAANTVLFDGAGGNDLLTLTATNVGRDVLFYDSSGDTTFADANGDSKVDAFAIETIRNFLTTVSAGATPDKSDQIDLTAFQFAASQRGVLVKPAFAQSFEGGDFQLTPAVATKFFDDAGTSRGVAIGTQGGNTYVFIDTDNNGNLTTVDLVFKLDGVTNLGVADFVFV